MNDTILIVSNTNLFSILSPIFLDNFKFDLINVRYSNEYLTRDEQIIQQLKEMRLDYFHKKGIIKSKNDFVFNVKLTARLEQTIQKINPGLILFEMETKKEQEWALLQYLKRNHAIPVIVFSTSTIQEEDEQLMEIGVSEVLTSFDKERFKRVVKRHLVKK
jgi:CheY-like chemotaxis protein